MPAHSVHLRVARAVAEVAAACDAALVADGWEPRERPEGDVLRFQVRAARPPSAVDADLRRWCVERGYSGVGSVVKAGNQVVAEIALYDRSGDATDVVVGGDAYGLGPIQQRHVKQRVESLAAAIAAAAAPGSADRIDDRPSAAMAVAGPAVDQRSERGHAGRLLLLVAVLVGIVAVSLLAMARTGAPPAPAPDPSALPSVLQGGFPHEDPALEAILPRHVGDHELITWSVRGQHVLEVQGESRLPEVLERLGASVDDVSLAIAGRTSTSEPPNWVFAFRVAGHSGAEVREANRALVTNPVPSLEPRSIDGRSVEQAGDGATTMILLSAGDAFVTVMAPLEESAVEMARQVIAATSE